MRNPPCPEWWYRSSDIRTLVNGRWVKRPLLTTAQRKYVKRCANSGTPLDPEVFNILG